MRYYKLELYNMKNHQSKQNIFHLKKDSRPSVDLYIPDDKLDETIRFIHENSKQTSVAIRHKTYNLFLVMITDQAYERREAISDALGEGKPFFTKSHSRSIGKAYIRTSTIENLKQYMTEKRRAFTALTFDKFGPPRDTSKNDFSVKDDDQMNLLEEIYKKHFEKNNVHQQLQEKFITRSDNLYETHREMLIQEYIISLYTDRNVSRDKLRDKLSTKSPVKGSPALNIGMIDNTIHYLSRLLREMEIVKRERLPLTPQLWVEYLNKDYAELQDELQDFFRKP